jgi:hypothetical protein
MTVQASTAAATQMPEPVRFGRKLEVRCPVSLAHAVGVAAARKQQRAAEWLRAAIRAGLRADGIDAANFGA